MNTRPYKSVEARSATALHLKVAALKAAGWIVDGPVLQVTDFCHRRPIQRFSQAMTKAHWIASDWSFA
ncbi:MAG TPA: hypothetical protein VG734_08680 [Lacunisphaera sp.]|nr:hypothetical protein [Lacunisphaera sp.]